MKILFSGSSNKPLAEKIAKSAGVELGKTEITRFGDDETRARLEDDVKGKEVYILQSLCPPTDKNLMELLLMGDAGRRNGGRHLTALIPWLGYSKQDKLFREGEAVGAAVVAAAIASAGYDKVITVDLHSELIKQYWKIPLVELSMYENFLSASSADKKFSNAVLVAPDLGGLERSREFAAKLNIPLVQVMKERDRVTAVVNKELKILGDVAGKTCLLIDDSIFSGQTLIYNAALLKSKGAREVICFVTHPVFDSQTMDRLSKSPIDKLYVSDSVPLPVNPWKKIEVISIAPLFHDILPTPH